WLALLRLRLRLLPRLALSVPALRIGLVLLALLLALRLLRLSLLALLAVLTLLVLPLRHLLRRLHQRAVERGILHAGLQLHCAVVGGDGLVVATGLGQRVAEVELAIGAADGREAFDRALVVLAAVSRDAVLHACVFGLVGAPPRAARLLRCRLRGGRRGRQQHRAGQHQRERAAATEQRQAQQHGQWQQPVTVVAPAHRLPPARGDTFVLPRVEHAQRAQVGVAGHQRLEPPAAAGGQSPQRRGIQPRAAKASAGLEHAAALAAQAQRGNPVTGGTRLRRGGDALGIRAIGQQQDRAVPESGAPQQRLRPRD